VSGLARRLRPAKVRGAVRRRAFEWRLARLPVEPDVPIEELGTAYGGWKIPLGSVAEGDICYCIGSGADISFDLELIRRYGATVRAVDPVEAYGKAALQTAAGEPRFSFRQAAVTTEDGPIRMQVHHEASSRSLSAAGLYDTDQWLEVDGRKIASLMREFGDDHIDLLKVDVEGIEYELVPTLDLAGLGVRVFSIQLHHTGTVRDAMRLVDGLQAQGFRLVAQRPSVKLTFVRMSAHTPGSADQASISADSPRQNAS
jgi:FkbM family methyltransferase